jgi:hypothetical protein
VTIDKSRSAFLAFAIFAISSIALTPASAAVAKPTKASAAVAKPTIAHARNHENHWTLRTPAAQSKRSADDPFACMLLG